MVLMALDHVRDFFGEPGQDPTRLADTTVPLFLTRWVTHLCAPVFFLLMGTGAWLSRSRKTTPELSWFLLTRGVWLILLELTVVRFAFQFNLDYRVTGLVVIWALGWALVVASVLVWLPAPVVAAIGVAMIAGHNALDSLRFDNPLWAVLHARGLVLNRPGFVVFAAYPLIPWVGVTAAGYGLGQVYRWPAARRQALLWRLGLGLSVAFVLLRGLDRYGDPVPWTPQPSAALTVVSFLNATKYPPSLVFLLMTLGPALLFLARVDAATPRWFRPALVFGRVPLFYFLAHLLLVHLLATLVCAVRFGTAHWMLESPSLAQYPFTPPPGWGHTLPVVYFVWALVVLSLFPACRWFAGLKRRRADWPWLGYL
jgi:uncharacterized membrane protein